MCMTDTVSRLNFFRSAWSVNPAQRYLLPSSQAWLESRLHLVRNRSSHLFRAQGRIHLMLLREDKQISSKGSLGSCMTAAQTTGCGCIL